MSMECYNYYWDCQNYKCKYYANLQQYCYYVVDNIWLWLWLIIVVISFITCSICCCYINKIKYQRIVQFDTSKLRLSAQNSKYSSMLTIPTEYSENSTSNTPDIYSYIFSQASLLTNDNDPNYDTLFTELPTLQ
ncbi:Hypothetical_protein [Hexamita inflata]|uniref:Hypothetical_protein n=1 Tax=Hexamita inflata TaxID=28002 RepID=A0ABP1IA96_9EUKA